MLLLDPLGKGFGVRRFAFEQRDGFGESPFQVRVADLRARRFILLARRTVRAFDQPSVRQKVADLRKAADVVDLVQHRHRQDSANAVNAHQAIGQDVGPEITRNGRGSFEHLLSNVFDPSLVIGASYQARSVITADGRILTGLLAEDNEQRIVLKTQGGKLEIVPRDEVEEIAISKLSLMPEGLEKQLSPDQLADLVAFISLDQPPENPAATPIAGTPAMLIGPR